MNSQSPHITFRTRPYVCGAIGQWKQPLIDALVAASPAPVSVVHSSPNAILLASSPPATWSNGAAEGFYWGELAAGHPPSDWKSASEGRMAAGLQREDYRAILHTDALGFQDMFVRDEGTAAYFSNRIDALVTSAPHKLSVNWDAWACTFAFTAPLHSDTPFTEITRIAPGTAVYYYGDRTRVIPAAASWLSDGDTAPASAADVVEAIKAAIVPTRKTALPLSGGWDSRLLGSLIGSGIRRRRAWTTSNDDGWDRDVNMAPAVASVLGFRHRFVIPGDDAWVREYAAVRHRTGFQTTHHVWAMPLYRELHRQGGDYLDGLAGGVLFKNFLISPAVANDPTLSKGSGKLLRNMQQRRLGEGGYLRASVIEEYRERAEARFAAAIKPLAGHPAAAMFAVLHTRTARAIASNPLSLLAPEVRIQAPFAHPDVIRLAMRVPLADKADGQFYRQMLRIANPQAAALPSTHDEKPQDPAPLPTRHYNQHGLQVMAQHITASDAVMSLFTDDAAKSLTYDGGTDLAETPIGRRTLTWASLFGHWLDEHRKFLRE
ncbi:asparagine synthase C-terminal domain-containing protein [Natronoglycomyces albus]|uniref:Asparagine synthetase domain-containing protein n=1 Tax=Natronoglycomyces albus TaxID=2811108 RepID=A0A895XNV8_9ACTN|nr:asparagine synthase C-terminal domain-containing protein [Natronoglycomyces albus]QSB05069.1 hypothetical protein JQS30_15120 [Natronoglycomyces albus]